MGTTKLYVDIANGYVSCRIFLKESQLIVVIVFNIDLFIRVCLVKITVAAAMLR